MPEITEQTDRDLARGLRNLAEAYGPSIGILGARHLRQCAARLEWLSQAASAAAEK